MSEPRGGCIIFSGYKTPKGYGQMYFNNKVVGAHRLAWALANGRMPKKKMDICHHCDNPSCINPKHLFEGSRRDNVHDALKKNRMVAPNRGKQLCKRGHEFTPENTTIRKCGRRECKKCRNIHQRKYRAKTA